MKTYETLLGCMHTDATVSAHNDNSYLHLEYPADCPLAVSQMLQAKDVNGTASLHISYNEDYEMVGRHYTEDSRSHEVRIDNGEGQVIVFPEHMCYKEYPQEEEEVSPCGQRGKIIAKWCSNEKLKEDRNDPCD